MDKKWSITDKEQGARTIEDMKKAAKLNQRKNTIALIHLCST
jgi:hypothetical protein